jgi:hypothetical protein
MRSLLVAVIFANASAPAQEPTTWVEAQTVRSLPGEKTGQAKTYFGDSFAKKKGTFKAEFESMLETKDSIAGEFLVAWFRYVYKEPNGGGSSLYPAHDESITKVLLDCPKHFSGTIAMTYKLKGKVVKQETSADGEIRMVQYSGASTVGDLCAFAKQKGMVP